MAEGVMGIVEGSGCNVALDTTSLLTECCIVLLPEDEE